MNFTAAICVLNDAIRHNQPAKIVAPEWENAKGEKLGVYFDKNSGVFMQDLDYPRPMTSEDYKSFDALPFDFSVVDDAQPKIESSWAKSLFNNAENIKPPAKRTSGWQIFGTNSNMLGDLRGK